MTTTAFTGCGTALVTPFTATDGSTRRRCVGWRGGRSRPACTSSFPCGTTGESPTLTDDERRASSSSSWTRWQGRGAGARRRGRLRHRARSSKPRMRMARRARTASCRSRRTTTSRRQEGLFQHYARLRRSRTARSSSTTCPGAPAATSSPATLVRLSAVAEIVGVKEASGNVSQICDVCRAVPDDFLVLSGDDALTLPVMALGGEGIISVAANEVPADMARHGRAWPSAATSPAARQIHQRIFPLMQVNFVESNPVPVKSAMAAMGLLEEVVPAADGPAARRLADANDRARARDARAAGRDRARDDAARLADDVAALVGRRRPTPPATQAARSFARLRAALSSGEVRAAEPDAVGAHRLAGEQLGEAGDPARVPPRRHRRRVGGSRPLAVLRQGHAAAEALRRRQPASASFRADRTVRDGAYLGTRRHLHAADVRQHRRLRRRGHARRLARAGRIVRADRRARAPQRRRPDWRRARTGRRAAR